MKLKDILVNLVPELIKRDSKPQISTGLKDLDNIMWGFRRGEVTIVAGRPSQGKSALSVFFAYECAKQDKKVALFSLEMNKEDIAERLLAMTCTVNNRNISRGQMTEGEKAQLVSYTDTLPELPLYIHDDLGFKWEDVEDYLDNEKPDMLIVDFVQMAAEKMGMQERQVYSEFIRKCMVLAKQYGCSIILNSQINRKSEDGRSTPDVPRMSELKGSGALEENAHKVLIVFWPHRVGIADVSVEDYIISVAKNRSGPTGNITVNFYAQYYSFKDSMFQNSKYC